MRDTLALLLVAPPGAGKGTQAPKLASHYGLADLSSGEILRANVAAGTRIGRLVSDVVARGDLVPDEMMIGVLRGPLSQAARDRGFILDGFPRTLAQAHAMQQLVAELDHIDLQVVIHLSVGGDELRRRLHGRAGNEGRSDDADRIVEHRLELFERQSGDLLAFYRESGLVVDINGERPVEVVFTEIVGAIDALRSRRLQGRGGAEMATTAATSLSPATEPAKGASPKAKMPPSDATNQ
jgi:adenylate kinase